MFNTQSHNENLQNSAFNRVTFLHSSAVARYQIVGGHTVNRGVRNEGAQLDKSQIIWWACARVATTQIQPCTVNGIKIKKYDLFSMRSYCTFNKVMLRNIKTVHLVCFISNVYKQRLFQQVEIFKNISNTTGWNSRSKKHFKNQQSILKILSLLRHQF